MSDDAVDKFFDEMVSPASTPTESTPPDEADKPEEPDAIMDDSTGRDEPELKPWSWGCWPSWNLRGRVPAADQSFGTPVLRAPKGCREDGQPVDASRYWVCRLARSKRVCGRMPFASAGAVTVRTPPWVVS